MELWLAEDRLPQCCLDYHACVVDWCCQWAARDIRFEICRFADATSIMQSPVLLDVIEAPLITQMSLLGGYPRLLLPASRFAARA